MRTAHTAKALVRRVTEYEGAIASSRGFALGGGNAVLSSRQVCFMFQKPSQQRPAQSEGNDPQQRPEGPSSIFILAVKRITDIFSESAKPLANGELAKEVEGLCRERLSSQEVALVVEALSGIALMRSREGGVQSIKVAIKLLLNAYFGRDLSSGERISGVAVAKLLQSVSHEAKRADNSLMTQIVLDALQLHWVSLTAAEERLVWRAIAESCFASSLPPMKAAQEEFFSVCNPKQLLRHQQLFEDLFEITAPLEREYAKQDWQGIPFTKQFADIWLRELPHATSLHLPPNLDSDNPEFAYVVQYLFQRFYRGARDVYSGQSGKSGSAGEQLRREVYGPTNYLIACFLAGLKEYAGCEDPLGPAALSVYNRALKGYYAYEVRRADGALEDLFGLVIVGDLQQTRFRTHKVEGIPLGKERAILEWRCPMLSQLEGEPQEPVLEITLSLAEYNRKIHLRIWNQARDTAPVSLASAVAEINGRRIDFGEFKVGYLNEVLLGGRLAIPTEFAVHNSTFKAKDRVLHGSNLSVPMSPKEFGILLDLFVKVTQAASYVSRKYPPLLALAT